MVSRRSVFTAAATCIALGVAWLASHGAPEGDFAGRFAGSIEGGSDTLGTPCGSCSDPVQVAYIGLAFRGSELWMVANDGTMLRTQDCAVLETISIQGFRGFATDLAWDSMRGVFVVTDPELDQVLTVRPDGTVLHTWPSPLTGPIGVAWDSTRDVYWVADWEQNVIHAVSPVDGTPGAWFAVPAGTRISGVGYDPTRDAIYYNGRNQQTCYAISAASHRLLGSFHIPDSGVQNGEGSDVSPDGRVWIHVNEAKQVSCFLSDIPTPTLPSTWGALKRRYLR